MCPRLAPEISRPSLRGVCVAAGGDIPPPTPDVVPLPPSPHPKPPSPSPVPPEIIEPPGPNEPVRDPIAPGDVGDAPGVVHVLH